MVLGVNGIPMGLVLIPQGIRQELGPVIIQHHSMGEMIAWGRKTRLWIVQVRSVSDHHLQI